jgi:hypothetical protein
LPTFVLQTRLSLPHTHGPSTREGSILACLLAYSSFHFPSASSGLGCWGCFPTAKNWDVGLQAPCTCVGLGLGHTGAEPNLVCAGTDDRRIFSENLGSLSKKRKGRVGFRRGGLRQMGFADPTSRGQNRSPVRDLEASTGSSPPALVLLRM